MPARSAATGTLADLVGDRLALDLDVLLERDALLRDGLLLNQGPLTAKLDLDLLVTVSAPLTGCVDRLARDAGSLDPLRCGFVLAAAER